MTASNDDRVLFEVDPARRIATITLNNPKQRNSYDATMREAVGRCLDSVADDDDLTAFVQRLESIADEPEVSYVAPEPSAEELVAEVERYLRDHGGDG